MAEVKVNWKDSKGQDVSEQLSVNPGTGTGNKGTGFGSILNAGIDRTLSMEVTTSHGVKKALTVNQVGCRQALAGNDGARFLDKDGYVFGVLKNDAPCQCTGDCPPPELTNYFVLYDFADSGTSGLNKQFTVNDPYEGYASNDIEEFIYEFGWYVESNDDGYNKPGVGGLDNPMMPGIASEMIDRGSASSIYSINNGFTLYLDGSAAKLGVGAFSYNNDRSRFVSIGLPGNSGNIKVSFKKTSRYSGELNIYVNDEQKSVLFMPYTSDGFKDLAGITKNTVTILGTEERHFTSFKHAIRTYEEHLPINS